MKAEFPHARHWSFSRAKRIFDSVASAAVLIVSCIPMAVIALSVRLSSAGPAIFVQKRVGRHGKLFRLYKFRTMAVATRGGGCGLTHSGDVRITPVGRWLRRLKLDELPQFYNVLRGDMSLVGPRPKLPQYSDRLTLAYRPGITGAASLAFRCEEDILARVQAHELDAFYQERIKPMKANIDERYMRAATFFSDVRIVFATLLASLLPDAYPALKHHEVTTYSPPERDRQLSAMASAAPPKRARGIGFESDSSDNRQIHQRIRVLQVNKLYAPWIGGVEAVVQEIAEFMNESRASYCEVLACQSRGGHSRSTWRGVPVRRIGSLGTVLSVPLAPTFPFHLRSMASEFDIVHVHLPFPTAFLCPWGDLKRQGVRIVVHYHSDIVRRLQRAVLKPLAGLERGLLEAADRIIVTSEGLLAHSRTLAPYREKCRVVPLSIDLTAIRSHSHDELEQVRKKFGIQGSEPIVLCVARLVYYKGVQHLIDAARNLNVRVVVAGDGPLRRDLNKQIEELGLADRVTLLGRVSDAELSCLYSMANIFVLPSVEPSEAFGLVQLEAMARGVPVINTDLPGGVPSVSLHGITGLTVPPGDSKQLSQAIELLASDRGLHERFSHNAKQRVEQFSRPVVLGSICEIYEELARARPHTEPARFAGLAATLSSGSKS